MNTPNYINKWIETIMSTIDTYSTPSTTANITNDSAAEEECGPTENTVAHNLLLYSATVISLAGIFMNAILVYLFISISRVSAFVEIFTQTLHYRRAVVE
jgi:hypothetical protein